MFRKITYLAKYPEIEKNTQKTLVAIKKRKNSLTVTLDTKKKHFPRLVGNMVPLALNLYHFDMP